MTPSRRRGGSVQGLRRRTVLAGVLAVPGLSGLTFAARAQSDEKPSTVKLGILTVSRVWPLGAAGPSL